MWYSVHVCLLTDKFPDEGEAAVLEHQHDVLTDQVGVLLSEVLKYKSDSRLARFVLVCVYCGLTLYQHLYSYHGANKVADYSVLDDRINEMRNLFVALAVGPNALFSVLSHWDNMS